MHKVNSKKPEAVKLEIIEGNEKEYLFGLFVSLFSWFA